MTRARCPAFTGAGPVWEGLGVLDHAIVRHYQSPDHPEKAACEAVAHGYQAAGVAHRTLRNGQALIIDCDQVTVC